MFKFNLYYKNYSQIIISACLAVYFFLILVSIGCTDIGPEVGSDNDKDLPVQFEAFSVLDGLGNEVIFNSDQIRALYVYVVS